MDDFDRRKAGTRVSAKEIGNLQNSGAWVQKAAIALIQAGQLTTTLFCSNGVLVPLGVRGVATRCPCRSKWVV